VPVTTLRQVTYQQPVVSYYYPPTPSGSSSFAAPPIPYSGPPRVDEIRADPPSVMPPGGGSDTLPPMNLPTQPGMSNPKPGTNTKLRPDKTASRSSVVSVRGEVVQTDQLTPRANAKLVFMNADKPEQKEYVTANAFGEFDLRLPAGDWYLYLGGDNGKATYHTKISLGDRDTVDYKVVSR